MRGQRKKVVTYWAVGASLGVLLVGSTLSAVVKRSQNDWQPTANLTPRTAEVAEVRQINSLKALPQPQRTAKLAQLSQSSNSPDRNRARYLLATELLQQQQPQKALEKLDKLDAEYPVLAPYVLKRQAQAYSLTGNPAQAQATWKKLTEQHQESPASAEALYVLGQTEPSYWDQLLQRFPAHPRSVEVAQQRLKQNPKQLDLLLLVARHGLYTMGYLNVLDGLVENHAAQLQPKDWEAIAFGYWEKQVYGKAGAAYARAPFTARNAYRVARGLQLGGTSGATAAYKRMVSAFPSDPETGLALIRLAQLVDGKDAIAYLDQAIQRFPDRAAEALLEKSKILDGLNSRESASDLRKQLLTQYSKSNAAAELRWNFAQRYAQANDLQSAWKWASPVLTENPDSELAPEAAFWVGKWAEQLGKSQEAQNAYEYVLTKYPESYYAWRSADKLGWQVGDFTTVRQLNPEVARPAVRAELPVGSETLKELHRLGQDQDAWALWQTEFQNPQQPSVAEQFTDGLMRLGVGDNLDGIFMVSFLKEREREEERNQYRDLKRQAAYWQALYPFPYMEIIENWAQERQLNPLLVTALIRQESRFMPGIQSSVGATGLMQVMPDTGKWVASKINLKEYKLNDPEDNIKLGTWYLDYTHSEYGDNSMLAVASYNAGPGAVADWVAKKGSMTDPDAFVEAIPYSETRGYVKLVFENYWNYLRLYNPEISQKLAQVSSEHPPLSPM